MLTFASGRTPHVPGVGVIVPQTTAFENCSALGQQCSDRPCDPPPGDYKTDIARNRRGKVYAVREYDAPRVTAPTRTVPVPAVVPIPAPRVVRARTGPEPMSIRERLALLHPRPAPTPPPEVRLRPSLAHYRAPVGHETVKPAARTRAERDRDNY